jgi:hypothetical protein
VILGFCKVSKFAVKLFQLLYRYILASNRAGVDDAVSIAPNGRCSIRARGVGGFNKGVASGQDGFFPLDEGVCGKDWKYVQGVTPVESRHTCTGQTYNAQSDSGGIAGVIRVRAAVPLGSTKADELAKVTADASVGLRKLTHSLKATWFQTLNPECASWRIASKHPPDFNP